MKAEMLKYIKHIRNTRKMAYALDYMEYLLNGAQGSEPTYQLSYMGAQAVRMSLYAIKQGYDAN